jgi:hypothetical protein
MWKSEREDGCVEKARHMKMEARGLGGDDVVYGGLWLVIVQVEVSGELLGGYFWCAGVEGLDVSQAFGKELGGVLGSLSMRSVRTYVDSCG